MQTKFYFLLGLLVGLTAYSSSSVAQTACFGYDSAAQAPDGFQLYVETFATFDGTETSPEVAALAGSSTYRIFLETPSSADYVVGVSTDGGLGIVELTTSSSFYMNEFGGITVNDINPGLFAFFPELEYDSYVTLGLSSEAEGEQSSVQLTGEGTWGPSFLAGGNLSINGENSAAGDGWTVPAGATNGFAGDDNLVILAQVTTDGDLNGSFNVQLVADGGDGSTMSYQFAFSSELCGCTDAEAVNYMPDATQNDGSCIYLGCMDVVACNYDANANEEDGTCDYCCLTVDSDNSAYGLELDLHDASGIPGLRTYRLYVTTENPTDEISAVTGYSNDSPLLVNTTTEFFQFQGGGGGVTPNAWNPMFGTLPGFEAGAYDSYVTIGLTETANLDAGETAISVVEDLSTDESADPWIADFEAGGNISTSNAAGGGWFVYPGYTNAVAGDDNRVLIGQFTTDGLMSGGMFVQVFPEGEQNESIEFYMNFSAPACACTDETACNFDPSALWDDGSCQDGPEYWGENITCDGDCLNDADGDYVCDEDEIEGCLNPDACNYVPAGTVTDLVDCIFPEEFLTCAGDCINDVDGDGTCDENELGGCTDATACNYDETATEENGTCTYLETITLGEVPSSSIAECSLFADGPNDNWQYVITSTTADDASSNEAQSLSISILSLPESGTNYRVAKTTANGNWFFGNPQPLQVGTNSITVAAVSFPRSVKFQFSNGDGEFDSIAINGETSNECTSSTAEIATCDVFEDVPNDNWQYVLVATTANDENSNAAQSFEMNVTSLPSGGVNFRVAKTTANGNWFFSNPESLSLGLNSKTVAAVGFDRSVKFQFQSGDVGFSSLILNDEDVNTCGGLQEVIAYDCDNVCYNDADGDGVCDELEVPGCTDESACNYDGTYTEEDGSCDYCCAATASVEGYNISIEAVQETPNGTQYRMYVETPNATDILSAVVGDAANPTYILSTQPIFRTGINTEVTANVMNPAFFPIFPSLEWESWVTIGIENNMISEDESLVALVPETTDWVANFNAGNGVTMEGAFGDGWYTLSNVTNGLSGDDQRVLVGQFTTEGILSGQIFVQMFPEGDSDNAIAVHLPFGYSTDDTEAPVFTSVPADMSQSCSDAYPTEMAVAVDEGCFPEATVTVSEEISDADCGYTLTRTFTATDAFGNSATAVQTVELLDSESPVAVAQADFTAQCSEDLTPGAGAAEYPTDSYDNCANVLDYSYVDAPFTPGFDLSGATADFSTEMGFNFGGPFGASLFLEANGVTIGAGAELTYDDLTSNIADHRGAIAVDIDGSTINLSVEGTGGFPFAYDYANVNITNISSDDIASVTINTNGIADGAEVSVSTTSNSISISWTGNATYAEGDAATASLYNPSTCLLNSGVMRTWTVTDDCGNADTAVQYITIIDTEGPTFTSTPQNIELNCNDEIPMGSPAAEDCSAVTMSEAMDVISDGSCGTSYTIHRTWTATDDCGNSTDYTQTIMVTDEVAPTFTSFPEDVTYTYGEDMEEVAPTAEDDCNEVTIDYSDSVDNSNIEITVITRTWTATDACGNSTSQDQIITVNEILGCTDADACNYNDGASYDDGSCDFCSCGSGGEAGFGLELELVEAQDGSIDGLSAGMNTYRVYVTTPSSDDFVSSVSGDEMHPAFLRSTTSFYQNPFGGLTPDNINPLFFTVVPALNYDSWLTIGIDGVAADGESAISVVQAPEDNWISTFNGGGDLELDSFFGGSWFALITANNGFAGDDQRVLVAQLTTDGDVSGQLYVQVFPNGDQSLDSYLTLSFGGNECGCMDETACNYSEVATYDDGSCAYPALGYDCDGECVGDEDGDGVCDDLEIFGCTVEGNCNYDPAATELDESMCAVSPFCIGCNDEAACNFNPNVIPEPNFNDGSCTYAEEGFNCDGECLDYNGDLICDILQGCGDESACNYEDVEYPSLDFCDFCSCLNVSTSHEGYGIDVESMASSIDGLTTYQVFVTTANSTDVLNAILGNSQNPIVLAASSEIYQNIQGSFLPSAPELFGFYPMLTADSYVTIGDNTPATVIDLPPVDNGGYPTWVNEFENGENIVIDDVVGSGWYIIADIMSAQYGVAGDDNRVLVAQISTTGTIHGELFVQIFPEGLSAGSTMYVSLSFGSDNCGCADETACNYSEENYEDDGSCEYPIDGEGCNECLYDQQPPVVVSSEDYTTDCSSADSDIREPMAVDECDPVLDATYVDAITAGDCDGDYTIVRTWTFADNAMNTASVVQTITVIDTTAPTFTVPADTDIACTDDSNDLTLTGNVEDAADACTSSVTVGYTDAAGDDNCFGGDVIVRTWTATDDCGNTSSADQIITLVDAVAPYFTSVPADVDLECGDDLPMDMATAEDVCSGVTVTMADVEGDANCTGMAVITRTFTATDGCGNSSTAVQTITRIDTQAPSGTVMDAEVSCEEYDATAAYGSYETSDNCMSEVSVSWTEVNAGGTLVYDEDESGDVSSDASNPTNLGVLPVGTTTITGATFNFQSINSDPEYFTIEVAPGQQVTSITLAEFSHVGFPEDGGGGFFGVGEGASLPVINSEEEFFVAAQALFGGALVGFEPGNSPGDDILDDLAAYFNFFGLEIPGFDETLDEGQYTFMFKEGLETAGPDAYTDYTLIIEVEEVQNGCFVVEREYTFTDECGNSSSAIQTITVTDDVAPVMDEVAAAVELQCGEELSGMPGATDNCSAVEVTYEDVETSIGCSGAMNFIRTYTAIDACGNSVSASQEVTFNDTIAPTFTAPMDVMVECDTDLMDPTTTGDVMDAADVCSVDIFVTFSDELSTSEGSCLADNVVTRTWTVTDGCGNAATDVQVITLEDTAAPVVIYEENVTLYDSASETIDDFVGITEIYDACSDYTYTTTDIFSGSGIYSYQLNRTMVFTDACGNSTTIEQFVTAIYSNGCTYADAMNYDEAAIIDDGSCVYEGCTDMESANYNPIASVDDGSCITVGCMDPAGYDYNPDANYPGGCDYPDPCPGDINDDGTVNVSDLLEFFQLYGDDCPE